jgi:hypothetical protein
VWRLGYAEAPLDFTPREYCGWQHRFDDPQREYRTLYCARERTTCLREVLQDFRPDARMLAEYRALFGADPIPPGLVPAELLHQLRLAPASIAADAAAGDADDVAVRETFARSHAELLAEQGMPHLDVSEVRSKHRPVTRAFSRFLFDLGKAGVAFRSNLDDERCFALFEGRAWLEAAGTPEPLDPDSTTELPTVLREFALVIG